MQVHIFTIKISDFDEFDEFPNCFQFLEPYLFIILFTFRYLSVSDALLVSHITVLFNSINLDLINQVWR